MLNYVRSRVSDGFGKIIMAGVGSIMRSKYFIMRGVGFLMGLER